MYIDNFEGLPDAYAEELTRQNTGEVCRHCGSPSGHYAHCGLLNRETAEQASAEIKRIDDFFLASLRIKEL